MSALPPAPLPQLATDSGHRYGTLCILDFRPRHFNAEQYSILGHFAEVVTRELERDKVRAGGGGGSGGALQRGGWGRVALERAQLAVG